MYSVVKHSAKKGSKKLVMPSSSSTDPYQEQQQQQRQHHHQPTTSNDGASVDASEEEGATAASTVCTGTSAGTEYHSTVGSLIASLAEEQEVVQRLQQQQQQQQQYASLSNHSRSVLETRPFEPLQQHHEEGDVASLYETVATFTTSRDDETLTSHAGADTAAPNPLLVVGVSEDSIMYPSAATAAATWNAPDLNDTNFPPPTATMSPYDNNDSNNDNYNHNGQSFADQDLLASSRRQSQDIESPYTEEEAQPTPFLEEAREQFPLQEDSQIIPDYIENDEEVAEDAVAMLEVGNLVEATLIRDVDETSHYDYEEGSENGETISISFHNSTSNDNDNITTTLDRPMSSVIMTREESLSTMMMPPTTVLARDSTGRITVSSDLAVVEAKPVETPPPKAMSRKLICAVMAMLVVVIVALSVGFVVSAKNHEAKSEESDSAADPADESSNGGNAAWNLNNNSSSSVSSTVSPITTSTPSPVAPVVDPQGGTATTNTVVVPVLQRLREQGGPLRCGVIPGPGLFYYRDDGEVAGFDASLCAAVAAAATGDSKNVAYQEFTIATILKNLKDGVIDIAAAGATHTMERQVYVADVGSGFQFTVPYLYQGMQLAGVPFFVECGDQGLEYIAACERDGEKIVICVVDKSTHQQKLSSFLPGQRLIGVDSRDLLRESLANGTCNVIAHEGYNLAEPLIRQAGYTGEYTVGRTLFTKEPLAIITSPDDPQFGDFANSVLQSLIVAEANNITQSTADQFQQTSVFGEQYSDMFRRALAAGGNYGELFARYLEPYSARQHLNLINDDSPTSDTGLLYAHPFGSVTAYGQEGETFKAIHGRGHLRCAVRSNRPGFAAVHSNGTLTGLEVDFCRGLSASIFEGGADAVHFVEVNDELEGFTALALDEVDVFAGATRNLLNDVKVPGLDKGFSFTQPYFYGGSSLLNSTGLLKVEELNLCLATRQEDHLWSSFVYWIAAGIIEAEEAGITQGMSNNMPDVFLFGSLYDLMFQDAILAVGNYHEIYQKHLQEYIPRSGRNQLNQNSGPQLYPYL